MGVSFLTQIGNYYLEVDLKQKDLKHALAGLLVEILAPAAGVSLFVFRQANYFAILRKSKLRQIFRR